MLGTVKWFNVVRGFGFIIGDDGNEYFFHYSNIKGKGFKKVHDNEDVEFEPSKNEKGFIALNVQKHEWKVEDDPRCQLAMKIMNEFGIKIPMLQWVEMDIEELEQYYDSLKYPCGC